MSCPDYDIGMLALVANEHWKQASWLTRAAAWALGHHQVFEHLDRRFRISFFRDRPFLLTIREVN